ncbi:contractile injection system tape measure protein [Pontimicrobium sp. MEBiC06410]
MKATTNNILHQNISIPNAGIVILQSYIMMLFIRLDLIKERTFITQEAQLDAVHYLQYLVTGLEQTEVSLLPLNKVLCGLAVDTPMQDHITISDDEKTLMNSLIKSAIDNWDAIGQSTVNGFRGNWLVRDGLLVEQEDRWELTVEKRAYDILLIKSPLSFSIIKLPWMTKPLHVNWPY